MINETVASVLNLTFLDLVPCPFAFLAFRSCFSSKPPVEDLDAGELGGSINFDPPASEHVIRYVIYLVPCIQFPTRADKATSLMPAGRTKSRTL